MNDSDRQEWVMDDESLYVWYRSARMPIRRFVRENRAEISVHIKNVLEGWSQ